MCRKRRADVSSERLVNYAGLDAGADSSGDRIRRKGRNRAIVAAARVMLAEQLTTCYSHVTAPKLLGSWNTPLDGDHEVHTGCFESRGLSIRNNCIRHTSPRFGGIVTP